MTQAALAARIQKPQSFISKLEHGLIPDPSIGTVMALAKVLGVDPLALDFRGVREAAIIP